MCPYLFLSYTTTLLLNKLIIKPLEKVIMTNFFIHHTYVQCTYIHTNVHERLGKKRGI